MERIQITNKNDYDYCREEGFEPLIDSRFDLDHKLRIEIQTDLFGKGHTPEENERFYRWVWAHKPHICEECMKPLSEYSATYISHIISRGANPYMAHDPRNCNILCFKHHNQYEHKTTRENMRIFQITELTIKILKEEYR